MQHLLLPTTDSRSIGLAEQAILDRSPLYDKDLKKLYVKYNGKLNQVSASVDEDNIIFDKNGNISLNENLNCKTATIFSEDGSLAYKSNVVFGTITAEHNTLLLCKLSDTITGSLSGMIYEKGDGVAASYHISISSSGSHYFRGASSLFTKARLVILYKKEPNAEGNQVIKEAYLGIKFFGSGNSTIYFSGFDKRPPELIPNIDAGMLVEYQSDTVIDEEEVIRGEQVHYDWTSKFWEPYKFNWNFNVKPAWMGNQKEINASFSEPDLTNGLSVSVDWLLASPSNKIPFAEAAKVAGDVGNITINKPGKSLKLVNAKDRTVITIKAFYNNKTRANAELALWDIYNAVPLKTFPLVASTSAQVWTTPSLPAGTYFFGLNSTGPVKILSIDLNNSGYDGNEQVTTPGHPALNYHIDFSTVPERWSYDLGNGIYTSPNTMVQWDYDKPAGEVRCKIPKYENGGQEEKKPIEVLIINNLYNNATLDISCRIPSLGESFAGFVNISSARIKLLPAIGGKNNELTLGGSIFSSRSGVLSVKNIPKGKYSVYVTNPVIFTDIKYTYPAEKEKQETIKVPDTDVAVELEKIITGLPETRENGIPNEILVTSANLTKKDLRGIAASLRDSDKLIALDMSGCNVAPDAQEWFTTFENCTSLAKIIMPKGVTKLGVENTTAPFTGCMFLSKLVLPDSLTVLNSNDNQSLFIGTRIRTLVLPKGLSAASIGSGTFKDSGVRNLVYPPDFLLKDVHSTFKYGSFFYTLPNFMIYMSQEQYAAHNWTQGWEYKNVFNDLSYTKLESKISVYTNFEELLKSLNY